MKDALEIKAGKADVRREMTRFVNQPTGKNRARLLEAIRRYEEIWAAGPYEEAPEDDEGAGERRVPRMRAAE